MKRRILYPVVVLFITGVTAFSIGCGGKKNPTGPIVTAVPESWGGVWSVRTQARLCGTTADLADTTVVETLCPGESLNDLFAGTEELCPGAALTTRESGATFSCSQPFNDNGCAGTMTINISTTVSGGSGSGTGRVEVKNQHPSTTCPDVCIDIVMTMTRIQPTPESCGAVATAPHAGPWSLWRAALVRR